MNFLIIFLFVLSIATAEAGVINFEVKGNAKFINSALAPYFKQNDEMILTFNMDLDVVGREGSWSSSYLQLSTMNFSIGAFSGTVDSYRPSITNGPNCPYTCGDVWAAEGKNDYGTTFNFQTFGNYYLDIVHLEYYDPSGNALNTNIMRDSIGQLNNFDDWSLSLYFKDINNSTDQRYSVRATKPSVIIAQVTEPSTIATFMFVLFFIMANKSKTTLNSLKLIHKPSDIL